MTATARPEGTMLSLLEHALLAAHLLSGAAWFGALVYRAFFVEPRAERFFGRGGEYESFSLHLADGMRYVVLLALLTCGLSGIALMGLHGRAEPAWLARMAVKAGLWLAAFAVFVYISWVYWPRRLFATEAERRLLRRQGVALSLLMIAFAGAGLVLGQWGRVMAP
jgi:hypothetical protein